LRFLGTIFDLIEHPEHLLDLLALIGLAMGAVLAFFVLAFPFCLLIDVVERRADRKRFAPRPGQSDRRRLQAQPGHRCLCGGTFKIRRRHADGVRFLGCGNYPKCRETRTLARFGARQEGR
jgi:hypothetical protein